MDMPWISITGIKSIEDINVVNTAIINSNIIIPTVCNFCGSYKRLDNYAKEGEHSCSIYQLINIGRQISSNFVGRIGLHFLPNPNGKFRDDCIKYVSLIRQYFNIEQLTIVALWPDREELELLKSNLNIDLVIQIPLYRIKRWSIEEIENKLLDYLDIATAFIFDTSGGNGVEHNLELTIDILLSIAEMISNKVCIAGGLHENNVFKITQRYFRQGVLCAVDAQSCMIQEGALNYKKILGFLLQYCKSCDDICWR